MPASQWVGFVQWCTADAGQFGGEFVGTVDDHSGRYPFKVVQIINRSLSLIT